MVYVFVFISLAEAKTTVAKAKPSLFPPKQIPPFSFFFLLKLKQTKIKNV